jgi:hypothetical protein
VADWDWVTISALATAAGTLVLALATFASVRSANRAARVAEQALLVNLRPLLVNSRFDDPEQKVGFVDDTWVKVPGGGAAAQVGDEAVYLAISVRNAGSGIAVLHGWCMATGRERSVAEVPPLEDFHRLSRDIFIAPGDIGFWQGAFRDPSRQEFEDARRAVERREYMVLWLLYGDYEGGQRVISQFGVTPRADDGWMATVARHTFVDGSAPR